MSIVKYSTSNIPNTIRANNVAVGINNVGYGPTNITGFYSGSNVPSGGYVIYRFPSGAGSPNVYVAQNDTELINLAGRSNATTVAQAISHINGLSNTIIIDRNYENIVTDGLVLCLDAGTLMSYLRNGTTWRDISGNNFSAVLNNGPTFNSDGGGCIILDGSNDNVDIGDSNLFTNPNGFTVSVWFKPSSYIAAQLLDKYQASGYEFVFGTFNNGNLYAWVYDNNTFGYRGRILSSISSFVSLNTWGYFTYTYDGQGLSSSGKIYINGTERVTSDFSGGLFNTISNTSTSLNIGRYNPGLGGPTNGRFGIVKLYNRALTASEILQNYNAQKARFGL
jgi:hypothetical protein